MQDFEKSKHPNQNSDSQRQSGSAGQQSGEHNQGQQGTYRPEQNSERRDDDARHTPRPDQGRDEQGGLGGRQSFDDDAMPQGLREEQDNALDHDADDMIVEDSEELRRDKFDRSSDR